MNAMHRIGIALLFASAALTAHASCEQPPLVIVPSAEQIEGRESQIAAEIDAYFQAMHEYVNCIRADIDAAGEEASELYLRTLVQRNNLAVAEAEAVQRWYRTVLPDGAPLVDSPPGDSPPGDSNGSPEQQ